ncbi:MAG TPA: amino acid ABC transporter permease [Alphaproteobacteria bacterium]
MTTDASSSPGVTPKSSVPAFRGTFDGGLQEGGRLRRIFDWLRRNLFSSYTNTALTILMVGLLVLAGWPFIRWAIVDATISGAAKSACTGDGACWTFIKMRLPTFFYGRYPADEIWRVNLVGLLLVAFGYPVLREKTRHRGIWLLLLLAVFPIVAGVLLVGGIFRLTFVDTNSWGGLMLDVIISFVTVAGSLPLGILLALGRRSQLPIVRLMSVGFIELWRGVPLLTALFMSAVMVPLFLPEGVDIDRLVRAMVALVLFNSAYMAETVRGGLQGVPLGQEEAAYSIGLRWWQVQVSVTLPQALRYVTPGLVNNIVDLFKDTTLVTIVGLFDLLGAVSQALKDPAWLGFAKEGFVFSALVFFVCCFAMSSYGRRFERRLSRHKR